MMKKIIVIPIFFVGMAALITWILMLLWNWLMPDIFELGTINFWQALGLLTLSKILFGGMSGGKNKKKCCCDHKSHGGWKDKFKNKWMNMSEADKQKWEQKFAGSTFVDKHFTDDKTNFEARE